MLNNSIMKKFILSILFLFVFKSFTYAQSKINWMSFEEAVEANEKAPRKILIDVYTDWCGWCKRMDATTFSDPQVVEYVNKHYYAVKLNAEKEKPIILKDSTYQVDPKLGRNGTHTLAVQLLNGKMSYPTIVYLDDRFNMLSPVPGFMSAKDIEKVLRFFGENIYLSQKWETYSESFKGTFN
jgi:thioredoxin-related protein